MLTIRPQSAQGLGLAVVEITTLEIFAGISRKATTENHFKVAQELANDFVDVQSRLRYCSTPQVTVTLTGTKDASGEFDYFIGERVQKATQEKSIRVVSL
jgi:hypothetical protein